MGDLWQVRMSSDKLAVAISLAVIATLGVGGLAVRASSGEQGVFRLSPDALPENEDWSWELALGDVDGDTDLDIVMANEDRDRLYLNDGSGKFRDATAFPPDASVSWAVAMGDIDGDQDLDTVFANTGQNRLCLNDGTGTFTDVTVVRFPEDSDDSRDVALGDIDGDGDQDIVFANRFGRNRLYLNDGAGVFSDAPIASFSTGGGNTRGVALGDVDGDGDLDMVFAIKDARNRLHLNDGLGSFTEVTETNLPEDYDNTRSIAFGDVDSDRDLDIIFANRVNTQSRLYLNDGSGLFSDATLGRLPLADDWSDGVVLGDVDGDSDLDIVMANFGAQSKLYLNDGSGVYSDATLTHLPAEKDNSQDAALGDMDGDGDLDIVFAVAGMDRLYLNQGVRTYPKGLVSCAFSLTR